MVPNLGVLALLFVAACASAVLNPNYNIIFVNELPSTIGNDAQSVSFLSSARGSLTQINMTDDFGQYQCYIQPIQPQKELLKITDDSGRLLDEFRVLAVDALTPLDGNCIFDGRGTRTYYYCQSNGDYIVKRGLRDGKSEVIGKLPIYSEEKEEEVHKTEEKIAKPTPPQKLSPTAQQLKERREQLETVDNLAGSGMIDYEMRAQVIRETGTMSVHLSDADVALLGSNATLEAKEAWLNALSMTELANIRHELERRITELEEELAQPEEQTVEPARGPRPLAATTAEAGVGVIMQKYDAGEVPTLEIELLDPKNASRVTATVELACGPVEIVTRATEERGGPLRMVVLTNLLCGVPGFDVRSEADLRTVWCKRTE